MLVSNCWICSIAAVSRSASLRPSDDCVRNSCRIAVNASMTSTSPNLGSSAAISEEGASPQAKMRDCRAAGWCQSGIRSFRRPGLLVAEAEKKFGGDARRVGSLPIEDRLPGFDRGRFADQVLGDLERIGGGFVSTANLLKFLWSRFRRILLDQFQ